MDRYNEIMNVLMTFECNPIPFHEFLFATFI